MATVSSAWAARISRAIASAASEPFPLPSTSRTLRAPLLPDHLDRTSRRSDRQRLRAVSDGSTSHQPTPFAGHSCAPSYWRRKEGRESSPTILSPAQDAPCDRCLDRSWSWRGTDLINAASRSAGLNPAELTANQQVFGSGEVVLFVPALQDLCWVSLRCSIASHARGRWFEPSRAHVGSPEDPGLFACDCTEQRLASVRL